jgi:glycosyltransferase involved in cell wall biosynthesis
VKILIYNDSDVFAGTERHIAELFESLAGRGVSVSIACPDPSPVADRARRCDVPVLALPKKGLLDTSAIFTLRRLLRSGEVDVIHAHNGRTALAASLAVRLAGRGRCVVTQHFLTPSHAGRSGSKGILSRVAHGWVDSHTHAHIAISSAVRDSMIARGDSSADEIDVVPNGISPPQTSSLAPVERIRVELGIPQDAVLIVCASRLEPEKDLMTLLEAMPLLAASPPVKLVIAGAGAMEVELRNKIRDWQLTDCCTLLGFREDVLSLINAADVFVLPSKVEGFGLVFLEAMSMGKPVIAAAAGGPLEIVLGGSTGLLFKPGDPASLAAAMQKLIDDAKARAAMGCKGRERFKQHFTADRMGMQTLDVYERAMGIKTESARLLEDVPDPAPVH